MLIVFAFPKFHGYIYIYNTKDKEKTKLNMPQENNNRVNFQGSIYALVHSNH